MITFNSIIHYLAGFMRRLFVLVIFIVSAPLFGQELRHSLRNYKAVDGLPQSQVTALLEDRNGYLWLGTEGGGLARFDGRNFKVYTSLDGMQSNFIRYLMLDSKDNLWIMHPRGISRFNGFDFKKFEQPGGRNSNPSMRRIYEFQDTLFFMSAPGNLGKIYNDSVYYWSKPITNAGLVDDLHPLIRFARRVGDAFVFCVDGKSLLVRQGTQTFLIPVNDMLPKFFSTFVYKDELWIQSEGKFWKVDLSNKRIIAESLPLRHTVMYYDSRNDLFWTTSDNLVFRETIRNGKVLVDEVANDLTVSSIVVDSDGATWLGTNGKGLFKFYVQDFDRFAFDGIEHILAVHVTNDGAIWVGSATNGLYRIKDGKSKKYPFPPGTSREAVLDIHESPDGRLLVAASPGLGTYNKQSDTFTWQQYSNETWKPELMNIQFDENNGMWLGTAGDGLKYLKGDSVASYSTANGLNSNMIMANYYSVWHKSTFISDDLGVYQIKNGKLRPLSIPEIEATSVININPYRDSLLLLSTTGSGLVVINPETGWKKIITTRDGLGSDFLYFAAADKFGYIWAGSEKGISRITLSPNAHVSSYLHYDYDNGLVGVETNQNAFFFKDSLRLFGLVDGLYQFNDYPTDSVDQFKAHLTGIEVFYGETPVEEFSTGANGFFHIPVNLSLPHDKNHITFRFNKVNKRYPKAVQFRYILEGFDRAWSKPSLVTEATYGNLPPGKFTFKVMSSDLNGNWNHEVLSYQFTVRAPFYARTGFIAGVVLLLAALLSAVLYWRFKSRVRQMLMLERVRLAEQDKVRKDIARDFHDEMGNQLTRIIHYVSLLKLNGSATVAGNMPELYSKVEQSAKYLYSGTRDFIWSIDPSNDEMCNLFLHIRDFGEKLFEEKNISFRATKTIKDIVKLPYGFSREANLIFKEAMTNAFKYSQAKNVSLSLANEKDQIRLILEDDGVGFEKSNCKGDSCRGLKNMGERAAKVNAELEIISSPGKGTRIILEFTTQKIHRYGLTV